MNWSSNLSEVEAGDTIATIQNGWEKVKSVNELDTCPISTSEHSYMKNGYLSFHDNVPSAFTVPPSWLISIIGQKPCEFTKGQRVIVDGEFRYFSHKEGNLFYCFSGGKDEWSSKGTICQWSNCRAWKE